MPGGLSQEFASGSPPPDPEDAALTRPLPSCARAGDGWSSSSACPIGGVSIEVWRGDSTPEPFLVAVASRKEKRETEAVNLDDTIVAIATPPGRGGIGVVRLAGAEARRIALPMLRLRRDLEPGHAVFGELLEPVGSNAWAGANGPRALAGPVDSASAGAEPRTPEGARIDEVVVTYFARPHSYTTDDVIEISAHGSPVVLRHIVETAIARGARLAEPGEFTMRAFLNGRMDLTQAEAVRDLIESQTLYQAKVAAQQMEGA
ncbi:MAG TPA: hypothetical protein VEK33_05260, partial [Terriglobales bacterium]|nr:hypothetical protein [Terriglobales bacterium]